MIPTEFAPSTCFGRFWSAVVRWAVQRAPDIRFAAKLFYLASATTVSNLEATTRTPRAYTPIIMVAPRGDKEHLLPGK